MAQPVPTTEPSVIHAGDTLTWKKTLSDYPASDGWVLAYRYVNAAGIIDISSSADGDDHLVAVDAATSAAYTPGEYTWTAFVTKGADRVTVGTGRTTVKQNLAALTTGYDARSHARKMLDAIEAALESRATKNQLDLLSTSFDGLSTTRDRARLLELRDRYRREVKAEEAAERIAAGLSARRKVYVRF